jgi:hypothetical protein
MGFMNGKSSEPLLRLKQLLPCKDRQQENDDKMAMNRKKRNRAISAAAPAMPVNPNRAAMIAIARNIAAHFNILPPTID